MKKILLLMALVSFTFANSQVTIFEDDFESYADFEFENIGGWTQIDNDADNTYSILDHTFANQGYIGTAMVFNSSQVTTDATGANDLTGWDSHGGAKGLMFFNSTGNNSGTAQNDDYLITPQIDLTNATGSSLSLWVRTVVDTWGNEKVEILLSTTGTAQADFTNNLTGIQEPGTTDTEFTLDLSAYDGQQVYIAIHCVSDDKFALAVDDFVVTATSVASVNEDVLASQVSIYPTSTKDSFTINNKSNTALTSVSLYDVNGRVVLTQSLENLIGEKSINVSNLSTGMYFVQLNTANATVTKKLIKN